MLPARRRIFLSLFDSAALVETIALALVLSSLKSYLQFFLAKTKIPMVLGKQRNFVFIRTIRSMPIEMQVFQSSIHCCFHLACSFFTVNVPHLLSTAFQPFIFVAIYISIEFTVYLTRTLQNVSKKSNSKGFEIYRHVST